MFKKTLTVIGAIVLVGTMSLLVVGSVFAQEPSTATSQPWCGEGLGRLGRGLGVLAGTVRDAVADVLGLTPEEICAARAEGQTFADLAEEQGISEQALIDAILAGQTEAINQALEDGRITQEQADWLLEKAEATVAAKITSPLGPGGMGNNAQGRARGGMRGGRGMGGGGYGVASQGR